MIAKTQILNKKEFLKKVKLKPLQKNLFKALDLFKCFLIELRLVPKLFKFQILVLEVLPVE